MAWFFTLNMIDFNLDGEQIITSVKYDIKIEPNYYGDKFKKILNVLYNLSKKAFGIIFLIVHLSWFISCLGFSNSNCRWGLSNSSIGLQCYQEDNFLKRFFLIETVWIFATYRFIKKLGTKIY